MGQKVALDFYKVISKTRITTVYAIRSRSSERNRHYWLLRTTSIPPCYARVGECGTRAHARRDRPQM
jgi:hypothetical protein